MKGYFYAVSKEELNAITNITLEQLCVAGDIVLNPAHERITASRWVESPDCIALVQKFYALIAGKENATSITYYDNWWQDLRSRILPKFWLKKYPSIKKRVRFQVQYPTIYFKDMEHKPYIHISKEVV